MLIPIYIVVLRCVSDRTVKPVSGLDEAIWRHKSFLKSLLFTAELFHASLITIFDIC